MESRAAVVVGLQRLRQEMAFAWQAASRPEGKQSRMRHKQLQQKQHNLHPLLLVLASGRKYVAAPSFVRQCALHALVACDIMDA